MSIAQEKRSWETPQRSWGHPPKKTNARESRWWQLQIFFRNKSFIVTKIICCQTEIKCFSDWELSAVIISTCSKRDLSQQQFITISILRPYYSSLCINLSFWKGFFCGSLELPCFDTHEFFRNSFRAMPFGGFKKNKTNNITTVELSVLLQKWYTLLFFQTFEQMSTLTRCAHKK